MSTAAKTALSRVGQAAISARMNEAEVRRDPAKALAIAMAAMRATLGLSEPAVTAEGENGK